MTVDEVQIRDDVERGAVGGPRFKTTVIGSKSGKEQRNREWNRSRGRWDISYPTERKEDYDELLAFFYARNGRWRGFLFKDWSDFEAARGQIGTGNGINTDFQLIKTYPDSVNPYVRRITRPLNSTVQVWVDNVLQTLTTDYTIEDLGIIRFTTAPADTLVVEAEFEFFVPVRFDIDEFALEVLYYDAAKWADIPLDEVRE